MTPRKPKHLLKKEGRKSLYRVEYNEQARKLCVLGATDADLADFWGVTVATLTNWKKVHPEFFASLKRGKIQADAEVADSLYQRAVGYSHKAVKIMQHDGASFEHGFVEHYPPDVAAAIFWLKNRQAGRWRNDQTVSQEVNKGTLNIPDEIMEKADAARIARLQLGQ